MKRILAVFVLAATLFCGSAAWAGLDLGDLLGAVAGGFLVEKIAGPINDFINTVTFNKGAKVQGHTKVVPIVSLGTGTRIGAAQIAGPKGAAVTSCKAVAQLEATFSGRFRVKILIPVDSINPLERFKRVQGVGVSAVIDYKL